MLLYESEHFIKITEINADKSSIENLKDGLTGMSSNLLLVNYKITYGKSIKNAGKTVRNNTKILDIFFKELLQFKSNNNYVKYEVIFMKI